MRMVQEGARVVACDVDAAGLDATARRAGGDTITNGCRNSRTVTWADPNYKQLLIVKRQGEPPRPVVVRYAPATGPQCPNYSDTREILR